MTATCPECGRVFDLLDEDDASEWAAGHDCVVETRCHRPARWFNPRTGLCEHPEHDEHIVVIPVVIP
jgi:hypothetical protein